MSRLTDELTQKLAGREKLREAAVEEIAAAIPDDTLESEIVELLADAKSGAPLGGLEPFRATFAAMEVPDLARRIKERAAK